MSEKIMRPFVIRSISRICLPNHANINHRPILPRALSDDDAIDAWKKAPQISFQAGDYVYVSGNAKAPGGGSNPVCLPGGSGK